MINLEPEGSPQDPQAPKAEEFVEEKLDTTPPPARPWTAAYYHSYFDVSTATVGLRLAKSIYPFLPGDFLLGAQADLYSPIWLCFTLVFVFTAGGTFTVYEESVSTDDIKWVENLQKVTVALLLFFGLLAAIPAIGRLLLERIDTKPSFADLTCLYGYSLTVYLPGGVLCLFPLSLGRIIILSLCGIWATFILIWHYLHQYPNLPSSPKRYIVVAAVLISHLTIVLAGNLYFFS